MATMITVTAATNDTNTTVVASDGTVMASGTTFQFDLSNGNYMTFKEFVTPVPPAPDTSSSSDSSSDSSS